MTGVVCHWGRLPYPGSHLGVLGVKLFLLLWEAETCEEGILWGLWWRVVLSSLVNRASLDSPISHDPEGPWDRSAISSRDNLVPWCFDSLKKSQPILRLGSGMPSMCVTVSSLSLAVKMRAPRAAGKGWQVQGTREMVMCMVGLLIIVQLYCGHFALQALCWIPIIPSIVQALSLESYYFGGEHMTYTQSLQVHAEVECRSQVSEAHLGPLASEQPAISKIWQSPFLPHLRKALLGQECSAFLGWKRLSTPGELSLPQMAAEDSWTHGCSLPRNWL